MRCHINLAQLRLLLLLCMRATSALASAVLASISRSREIDPMCHSLEMDFEAATLNSKQYQAWYPIQLYWIWKHTQARGMSQVISQGKPLLVFLAKHHLFEKEFLRRLIKCSQGKCNRVIQCILLQCIRVSSQYFVLWNFRDTLYYQRLQRAPQQSMKYAG